MILSPSRYATRRIRLGVLAVASASALVLTGCATGSAPSGDSSTSPGSSTSDLAAAQKVGLAYTGGKAGKADASLSPVKIGFINQEGATPGFPEATAAAQAAASFINDSLGGIGGHPLELVTCAVVSSEEDGQKCAQQMAADADIKAVQLGLLTVGQGSVYKTLEGRKPVIGGAPTSPVDLGQTSVPFFFGGLSAWPSIATYQAKTLKAKNVALVYDGTDPGAQTAAQLAGQVLTDNKVAFKSVPSSNAGDWSSALVSAGAQTADSVAFIGSPPTCVPFGQAATQLGVSAKVVTLDFCVSDAVKEALGDFPDWTYAFQAHNPYAPDQDPQVAAFRSAMAAYQPKAAFTTAYPFSNVMVLAKVLDKLGADGLTSDAIGSAMLGFTDPVWAGAQSPKCGFLADKQLPAFCATDVFLYSYSPSGGWSKPTVSAWQG